VEPTPVTYADIVIHLGLPLVLFMLGWLVKQNRDARIAMVENIGKLTKSIRSVEKELANYQTTWMHRKESLLDTFTKQCETTQGACRALVEIQLTSLKDAHINILQKLDSHKSFCHGCWNKQDDFNKKLLAHIADTKLHDTPK